MLCLAFCFTGLLLHAQTTHFSKYGAEEGLGSSKVYCSLQDQRDNIWLGTESGVSRFDGINFENYSFEDGISVGGVKCMSLDDEGRVWFGHLNGGISLFDGDLFHRMEVDNFKLTGDITSIRQAGSYIWVTTSGNGVFRFGNPGMEDNLLVGNQYAGAEGLSDQVHNSFVDSQGNLYCLADLGIRKYVELSDRFETYLPAGLTKYFAVISMFEDSNNNFWFGTYNGGLYKLSPQGELYNVFDKRDGLAKNWVTCITEDYRGDIWVGTWGGGVSVIRGKEIHSFGLSNGLDALFVQSILQDHENNILITDNYVGLRIYKGDHFKTYTGESVLPDNNVWAIEEDNNGGFWFGTNKGLSFFNPDAEMITPKFFNEPKYIIGNKVRFLKKGLNGEIWLGTDGDGLFMFTPGTGKFIYDTHLNSLLYSDGVIKALDIDKNGILWVGTNDGVVRWSIKEGAGRRYTQGDGLSGNGVISLFCDSNGDTWIGTERAVGITRYDNAKDKFVIVDIGEGHIPKIITETPDGRIWVGSTSGLKVLDKDTIAGHYTAENGLLSNNITSLISDPSGNLYIGSNQGLNRLEAGTEVISTFTEENGFTGIEARNHASFIDSRGRLWFGTANGVTRLDTELFPPVRTSPATHIRRMLINYQPRHMTDGMKLNYKERAIAFDYYSVCLDNPKSVRYMVMLEGAESTWRPVTAQTRAIYSALTPGKYTFMVKASNSTGYWNEEPVTYSFTIRPPFYLTPWFITSVAILLILAVILYIRMREYKLVVEKKILEEKVEERTAEVVLKSHEIEEKNRDITASIRYAERIQRAMLPPEDSFKDTFILFMPKDIVSGDFYWLHETTQKIFISAVDCTGHGVPGAFMSIIGYNSLNRIVKEEKVNISGKILDRLHEEVVKSLLQQHENVVNDGMDLSLSVIDKKSLMMSYAGAYNPAFIVREGELTVLKADRFPIGMASMENRTNFTSQDFQLRKGDMVYLFSDGYADQFGGPDLKKMKTVAIKNIVLRIWSKPIEEQKKILAEELMEWKGENKQIDDILFIGHRVV